MSIEHYTPKGTQHASTGGLDPTGNSPPGIPVEESLHMLMEEDERALGKYARLSKEGLDLKDMVGEEDYLFTGEGHLRQMQKLYCFIREGENLAKGEGQLTAARQAINRMQSLLDKKPEGWQNAEEVEQVLEDRLSTVLREYEAIPKAERARAQVSKAERINARVPDVAGCYVFSFPIFMENPDDERDSFRVKVGRGNNVRTRLKNEIDRALTIMPQPVSILRIYECKKGDEVLLESGLHALLRWGRFENPDFRAKQTGQEWFSIPLQKLDEAIHLNPSLSELVTHIHRLDEADDAEGEE